MRRTLGLAAALIVGLAGTALAGAMYRNDSGEVARAVRIEFSEPAEITSMWPSFPQREPQGPATVIVLSGGEVTAGAWFSFTWWPDSARVEKIEWFASTPSSARPNLGFSDPKAQPEVHGDLLNPAFFAHPAYVMQGVSERDKVSALPLHGVPELSFYPVLGEISASSLTWTFEVSHPEGIGAAIEDGTLYIWGSNPDWQGYGEVELHVSAPDGHTGWVEIPVVVFCSNRTLVNPQGKKDYFVPWGVILDINRILSTEEHMRKYKKPDLGLLDRTLRFSRWRPMEYMAGGILTFWWDERTNTSYDRTSVLQNSDLTLFEYATLGATAVNLWQNYFMLSCSSPEPVAVHDRFLPGGSTMSDLYLRYVVNEAHYRGLKVVLTVNVCEPLGCDRLGFSPPSWKQFMEAMNRLHGSYSKVALEVGVEGYTAENNLFPEASVRRGEISAADWNDNTILMVTDILRPVYPGVVYYMPSALQPFGEYFQSGFRSFLPVLRHVDVVGGNSNFAGFPEGADPTGGQVGEWLAQMLERHVKPLHTETGRPVVMNEGGMGSYRGAVSGFDFSGMAPPGAVYDGQEQAAWYAGYFTAEERFDFLFGFGWFAWSFVPAHGGAGDLSDSPRHKPAQAVIERKYLGREVLRPAHIDGAFGEWGGDTLLQEDPAGDSLPGSFDIVACYGTSDDSYFYLAVSSSTPFPPSDRLIVEVYPGDGKSPDSLVIVNFALNKFWAALYTATPDSVQIGQLNVQADESRMMIEFLIPRMLLGSPPLAVVLKVVQAPSFREADRTARFNMPM